MTTNKYFNNFAYAREQDLVEDLTIEAIKIYGHEVKYLPRTLQREDALFGEDTLSKFDDAIGVEMYIKNVEGFEGEGDFLSKFNLEIRDQITFTVARKRFDQARSEKLTTEVGYNYVQEEANTAAPSRQYLTTSANTSSFGIQIESGTDEGYAITTNRPTEGDLIFFPLVQNSASDEILSNRCAKKWRVLEFRVTTSKSAHQIQRLERVFALLIVVSK